MLSFRFARSSIRVVMSKSSPVSNALSEVRTAQYRATIAAVTTTGEALQCAPDVLKRDKTIVRIAVSKCGFALRFAAYELQDDRDIVMTCYSFVLLRML